jgi:uncharacterized membrane protein YkvA (DUF1232 family)
MTSQKDIYQLGRLYLRAQIPSAGILSTGLDYLFIPTDLLHLVAQLLSDSQVPLREKVKFGLAIAYSLSPLDLIPDFIFGPLGWIDDLAVAAYVLNGLLNTPEPEILEQHWAGEKNLLAQIQGATASVNQLLGGGLLGKLDPVFSYFFPK